MKPDLDHVEEALESQYNDNLSVFNYVNCLRLTNGSAAMFIDITINDDQFNLSGRRYGELIEKECPRCIDDLIETLRSTI